LGIFKIIMKEKIKVLLLYNEASPELYKKPIEAKPVMNFKPYFIMDKMTPMDEFEFMAKKLKKAGLDAYCFNLKDDIYSFLDLVKHNKPDVIFNFAEIFKEQPRLEMNLVGLYELLGIPYTGAPALALANCQNKFLTKKLLNFHGIKTPKFWMFERNDFDLNFDFKFPLIVKPAYEDASVGIENDSIVNDVDSLRSRISFVFKQFNQSAVVEEYIEGREFNVSVMGDLDPVVLPISEIDFKRMPDHLYNIVSYQAKWDAHHESYHKTIPICPAKMSTSLEEKLKKTAIAAFRIMGTRDYARVDIRVSNEEKIYVLEVNPNPDLTEGAGFMRSSRTAKMTYTETLKRLIMLAYERRERMK